MSTGDDIPPTIRPTAIITDVRFLFLNLLGCYLLTHVKYVHLPVLQSVREISGKNVPVWNWSPSSAYLPLRVFGPEKYGGLGDVANKARHLAETTGRDVEEVTKEVRPYFQYLYRYWRLIKQLDDEHEAG